MCEVTGIVRRMGNPFFDDGEDLVTLDIKLVMDSSGVQTLKTSETIGQYDAFIQERLVLCEKPLTDRTTFPCSGQHQKRSKAEASIRWPH